MSRKTKSAHKAFKVQAFFQDCRVMHITATDAQEAVEKATKRLARSHLEGSHFRVEEIDAPA